MLPKEASGTDIRDEVGATRQVPVETGAEAFIELLNANNVDCLFLNPGTDTTPIQEAVARLKALGKRVPRVILCLDEFLALSAAHGYFMITGRPQVVLVHVDIGTAQLGGALHNAQRGHIGVVLCAGRPPSIMGGEKGTSGRSGPIMWWQEQFDLPGIVRNFVKWEYELRSNEEAPQVLQRAFQMAATEPCGPAYLMLPRAVLTEKIRHVKLLDAARYATPMAPVADQAMLAKVADILAGAEHPLIIAGEPGRNTESVSALVELAESLGAMVVSSNSRMNFPTTHPLHSDSGSLRYLREADAILVIDSDIPYTPALGQPRPDCKIIQIDIDPVKTNLPMWGFPTDILLHAHSNKAIPALTRLVRQRATTAQKKRVAERLRELKTEKQQAQSRLHDLVVAKSKQRPIATEWLSNCLAEVLGEDTIILNDSAAGGLRCIARTKPGTLFGSGSTGLGWGLGAALGAKLAAPDRMVVLLVGDGSFVFGCPTAALWAANAYHLPILCVIFNNEGYNTVRKNLRTTCGTGNSAEHDSFFAGLDITPSPDYAMVARASKAYGETVVHPDNLRAALRRALNQVNTGRAAVLDVRVDKT